MATARFSRGSLIIKDDNLGANLQKKDGVNGNGKNILTGNKKGAQGLVNRKALNDITNKSVARQEVAPKRNNVAKEELNVKDERFLHDHRKCEEAHRKAGMPCFFETVLPGIDLKHVEKSKRSQQLETDPESPRCYPEPMEEPEPELSNGNSPRISPLGEDWDSPPSSPLAWLLEPVEFTLKPETKA
uniref:Uncharacterized protein n=1 Tax=Kalanchoe fedtschenkoi TaxID=63787 RepID=A0A7N0UTH5_KALFE